MACKKKKNLKALLEACVTDTLFDDNIKKSVFLCIIEIINNSKKVKLKSCFSSRTRKKIVKHKKLLNYLKNGKISLKKRKKRFIRCSEKEKKLFNNYLIADFISNCLECDDE